MASLLKALVPKREMSVPILRGPFRGARIRMVPHDNLRKMFGLYEHELNGWLEAVLPRVDTVLDVGGNNGYFAFGCAAAFRRLRKQGRVIVFEPLAAHCRQMRATLRDLADGEADVEIIESLVGATVGAFSTTLDSLPEHQASCQRPTLVKIDVEGAEIDVIAGASKWLRGENYFLIEVHEFEFLAALQEKFAAAGMKLQQIDQQPLPVIGRETRTTANWWLVSPVA